ncbi:G-protein coupled receptor 1 [Camellia lanceoleosa]|uniref:G-protein coupled receptor 1 n=1 Tax=Camellia lanceoleosa TaxID=1840588 RepID=A0ACC0FLX0_9ERIC|nr:G-protein coupled receptor 1 [Camellia lanceoleosa]
MATLQAVMGNLTASDRRILTAVNSGASSLSLLGSGFIVLCYICFKELRKFSFKLVFFLALSAVHFITFYVPLWGAIIFNGVTYFQVIRMLNNATRMAVGMSNRAYQQDARADMKALNRWGYYPLILIGSWTFGTINRVHDFIEPGHKIYWLSFLDVGMAALMGLFNSIAYGLNSSDTG